MEHASEKKTGGFFAGRSRQYTIVILLAIFVIGTILALSGQSGSVMAEMDSNLLGVRGTFGDTVFVRLAEITQVRLADEIDFGRMLEGDETKNTLSGRYENDAFGTYTLHVYPARTPYIVVSYGDGDTLVFNLKTAKLTRDIYEDLTES